MEDGRIDSKTLKVGDTIGVRETVCLGWKYFRYPITIPKVIKRITPKGTKIITEDGCEYDTRRTWFYKITAESKRQSNIALCAKKANYLIYELDKLKGEGTLLKISDDKLVEVCGLLNKIKELLTNDGKEV